MRKLRGGEYILDRDSPCKSCDGIDGQAFFCKFCSKRLCEMCIEEHQEESCQNRTT
jgi:hypothetical protein